MPAATPKTTKTKGAGSGIILPYPANAVTNAISARTPEKLAPEDFLNRPNIYLVRSSTSWASVVIFNKRFRSHHRMQRALLSAVRTFCLAG